MVRRISTLMGSDLEPDIRGEARHELPRQYLSAKKARERLDWHPLYTMDEGLERTVAWYRRYFEEQGHEGARGSA